MALPLCALEFGAGETSDLPDTVFEEFRDRVRGELDRAYDGPPSAERFLPLLDQLLTEHLRDSGAAALAQPWAAELLAEIDQTIDRAWESGKVVQVTTDYSFVAAALRMQIEGRMRLRCRTPVVYPPADVGRPWPLLYYWLEEEEEGEIDERSDFEAEFGEAPGESLPSVEEVLRRSPRLASREATALVDCSALAARGDRELERSLFQHLQHATRGDRTQWRLVVVTEESTPWADSRLARSLDWVPAFRFVPARLSWWRRLSDVLRTLAADALLVAAPSFELDLGSARRRWVPSSSEMFPIRYVLQLVDSQQESAPPKQEMPRHSADTPRTVEESREDCAAHFRSLVAWLAGLNHREGPPLATRIKRYESSAECLSDWEQPAHELDRQHVLYQLSDASCDRIKLSANALLDDSSSMDELVQRLEPLPSGAGQGDAESQFADLQVLTVDFGALLQFQRLGPRTAQFLAEGGLVRDSLSEEEHRFYGPQHLDRGRVLAWLRGLSDGPQQELAGAWPPLGRIASHLKGETGSSQWKRAAKSAGVQLTAEDLESKDQAHLSLACLREVGSRSSNAAAGFVSVTRERLRAVDLPGLQDGFNKLEGMVKFLLIALARLVPGASLSIAKALSAPAASESDIVRQTGRRNRLAAGVEAVAVRLNDRVALGTLVRVLGEVTSRSKFKEWLGVGDVVGHLQDVAELRNDISHWRLDSKTHKEEARAFQQNLAKADEFWNQLPLHAVVEAEATTEWGSQLTLRTEFDEVVTVPMHLVGGRPHHRGTLLGTRLLVARGPARGERVALWWAPVATEWPSALLQRASLELKEDV